MENTHFVIDHADIVVTHQCNKNCKNCIDKFVGTSSKHIELQDVKKFLKLISNHTELNKKTEILLLGGEPTILPLNDLIMIAQEIQNQDFSPIMSTNGILKKKILQLIPYFDWIQVTVNSYDEIDFYKPYANNINIKLAGDESLTFEKFEDFISYTKDFERRSITMYFKPDWTELCSDKLIFELLDKLDWNRNGSYLYAFYKDVRIKRCITNETNIIDEPTVPKLYPNGNYNKTWNNEYLDDYLQKSIIF